MFLILLLLLLISQVFLYFTEFTIVSSPPGHMEPSSSWCSEHNFLRCFFYLFITVIIPSSLFISLLLTLLFPLVLFLWVYHCSFSSTSAYVALLLVVWRAYNLFGIFHLISSLFSLVLLFLSSYLYCFPLV